eukprot:7066433-Pyramimonas_sp.AAC.1
MLDLFICDGVFFAHVAGVQARREAALATDHFLVCADLYFSAQSAEAPARKRYDTVAFPHSEYRLAFADAFNHHIKERASDDTADVEAMWQDTKAAMKKAAETLPKPERKANK